IYMEKHVYHRAHYPRPMSVVDYRDKMGCVVKRDGGYFIGTYGEFYFVEGSSTMKLLVYVPKSVKVEVRGGLNARVDRGTRAKDAINPTRDDPKPALTQFVDGTPKRWLAPVDEDGWHQIPAVPDVERRASQVVKGNLK